MPDTDLVSYTVTITALDGAVPARQKTFPQTTNLINQTLAQFDPTVLPLPRPRPRPKPAVT
jgi:hypothetical protein